MKTYLKHKFNAKPTELNGKRYDSKKEANYAQQLDILQKSGEILCYLRQVPIELPGKVKYRIDFLEFHKDGTVKFVDVKGLMTPMSKLKIKQVEDLYPFKINIV